MVNMDQWWNWDDDPSSGGDNSHTQKLPDGRHTGDIVKATISDVKYMVNDDNPSGRCLVVTWSRDGYYPVKADVPLNWRGLIEAICKAAGVACPQRGQDWNEECLVGRVATIDVVTKVAASGKEYQRITRWHPSPQNPLPPARPAAKRAPARTPAAKAHADFTEHADGDDIPF
jgi:hypothetical protein